MAGFERRILQRDYDIKYSANQSREKEWRSRRMQAGVDRTEIIGKISRACEYIEHGFLATSWAVAAGTSIIITIDVIGRFWFHSPLKGSWEISEVLMPYIVVYALPRILTENGHVRVSLITNLFQPRIRLACDAFASLVGVVVCTLVTYWSALWFWRSLLIREEISAAISIPWYVGKFALPTGFALFGLRYFLKLIYNIKELVAFRQ